MVALALRLSILAWFVGGGGGARVPSKHKRSAGDDSKRFTLTTRTTDNWNETYSDRGTGSLFDLSVCTATNIRQCGNLHCSRGCGSNFKSCIEALSCRRAGEYQNCGALHCSRGCGGNFQGCIQPYADAELEVPKCSVDTVVACGSDHCSRGCGNNFNACVEVTECERAASIKNCGSVHCSKGCGSNFRSCIQPHVEELPKCSAEYINRCGSDHCSRGCGNNFNACVEVTECERAAAIKNCGALHCSKGCGSNFRTCLRPLVLAELRSVEVCVVPLYEGEGGSSGNVSGTYRRGSSWSTEKSKEQSWSINSQVSAKVEGLSWSIDTAIQASMSTVVSSASSESGFMESEETWFVNLDLPAYLYQAQITIYLIDGSHTSKKGGYIQRSAPIELDNWCRSKL